MTAACWINMISPGARGKYADRYKKGTNAIIIDPDAGKDSESCKIKL